MDEINEMTRCVEVSFQGMKFAMEASQDALRLLSRMLQIFDNSVKNLSKNISVRREKRLAKLLSKETGKTSMELLKMKGQYMFGKMDKETFEAFRKQADKYGIQYAVAPTLEEGTNRIALRDIDIAAFEMFLKDYETAHCKTQQDISEFRKYNGLDSPVEYMQKSDMGKCSNEQYKQAMEVTYGKDWDKEIPQIQLMDAQKKREVFDAVTENEIKKAKEIGSHLVISFGSSQIFKENEHSVSFSSGSFGEGDMVNMTVEKEDMRYMEKNGKESFVALIPKDKYIDVVRYGDTIKMGKVKAEDYRADPVNSISRAEGGQELAAITISKDLEKERSEAFVTSRVPGTGVFGNGSYLQLPLEKVKEVHGGKSYFTYIDMNEKYSLQARDGSVKSIVSGRELLSNYDKKPILEGVSKKNMQEGALKTFSKKKQSTSYVK